MQGSDVAIAESKGRTNQKARTRRAIVEACLELIRQRTPVTMPEVAKAAMVSEATAYRYFPDLASLLAMPSRRTGPPPPRPLRRSKRRAIPRTSGLRHPIPPPGSG